jgi:tetratricopeptide (TPR) repeat protein
MDQLSAHLDRGWDLAQKGDGAGAGACARRALELDPKSPEVHNLLGYAAALDGDADEALEHYRQAIALDETYFEAMLNAAEVMIYPLGDYDGAIEQIDEALDLAETDEETADGVLLKVDALMAKGGVEEAKRAMRALPDGAFENPSYMFLIGRAYYELGDVERAAPLVEEAAKRDGLQADAAYYLGLVRSERADARGATEAFLRTRALATKRPVPSWSPSPEAFATIVRSVVEKLDAILARYVREADVFVVDLPGAEYVVDGVDPRALLVLDVPPTDGDGDVPRARIFVYQRNLERCAGSPDALEDELRAALEREITSVFLDREPTGPQDKNALN